MGRRPGGTSGRGHRAGAKVRGASSKKKDGGLRACGPSARAVPSPVQPLGARRAPGRAKRDGGWGLFDGAGGFFFCCGRCFFFGCSAIGGVGRGVVGAARRGCGGGRRWPRGRGFLHGLRPKSPAAAAAVVLMPPRPRRANAPPPPPPSPP